MAKRNRKQKKDNNRRKAPRKNGSIVVIGAGLAGLTAASKLAETLGSRVLLLERKNFTGGMAHTFTEEDLSYDYGSHRIHPAFGEDAMALIRELTGEKLMLRERRGKLRLGGKYMHYPPEFVDFLRGLGIRNTVRGGASFVATKLFPPSFDGVAPSYETAMIRRTGQAVYDLFYAPYAWKVYGIDPKTISPHASKTRVSLKKPLTLVRDIVLPKTRQKKYFYYPYPGIGMIAEELEKRLVSAGGRVLTGVDVRAMRMKSRRIQEVLFRHNGRDQAVATDLLIPTISINGLIELFARRPPAGVTEAARSLKWRGLRFLYICLNKDRCSESETHYYPESRYAFGRMSEPKLFSPHMVRSEGKTVLCVELPSHVGDPFWSMKKERMLDRIFGDLRELGLVGSKDEIFRLFSKRLPSVYPIYDLPWEENFNTVHRFLETVPNLYPIGRGSLFLHDNMDHAIRMGLQAAAFIATHFEKNDAWSEVAGTFRHFGVRD